MENEEKNTEEHLSRLISSTLHHFGFSKEKIDVENKFYEDAAQMISLAYKKIGFDTTLEVVGSKGEGIAPAQSDSDLMIIVENIVCVDESSGSEEIDILEADYKDTAPGYTKVAFVQKRIGQLKEFGYLKSFLFPGKSMYSSESGYPYVSSLAIRNKMFMVELVSPVTICRDVLKEKRTTIHGPAVTKTYDKNSRGQHCVECDTVAAVRFYGGDYLQKWGRKTRFNAWPSRETIKDLSDIEGYIVPVGDKQSENQSIEWRICYTTAEKKLVSTFNNTQLQLYFLLKMFAKKILKPVCKEMTSYVMKNVVFWVSETTSKQCFQTNFLTNMFIKSLWFIKYCIENNHFPNYMIPERNLLKDAVGSQRKVYFVEFISGCLREGGWIIMGIPTLNRCISFLLSNPATVIPFLKWCQDADFLLNELALRILEQHDIGFFLPTRLHDFVLRCLSSKKCEAEVIKFLDHVMPEWRMHNVDEIIAYIREISKIQQSLIL